MTASLYRLSNNLPTFLLPFLWMGVMLPFFQPRGNIPFSSDLQMLYNSCTKLSNIKTGKKEKLSEHDVTKIFLFELKDLLVISILAKINVFFAV